MNEREELEKTAPRLRSTKEPEDTLDGAASSEVTASWPQIERVGRYRFERVLGEGGFGRVYLAQDEQLDRQVTIKLPHPHLVASSEDVDRYLAEARTVAGLDHPHIVPVYDVGTTEQFPLYVVSKLIDGTDLATKLEQGRLPAHQAADLVATVAEALHFTHTHQVVHRDVKPGNILIDREGTPYVVDFGLALSEAGPGSEHTFCGTPSYMSPEQARGEGHRVDGRSDIYSLGVVFYELLVGQVPFCSPSLTELVRQITTADSRPPRQIDDSIPRELERICLKAMSRRLSDRYTTAKDMAEDLRHFLAECRATSSSILPITYAREPAIPESVQPSERLSGIDSSSQTLRIVPKGLRSFDEHDSEFFLELLPGPRDREGLPGSIRFWKTRIEDRDAERTFPVGLIYGPSGCGKSSLVKAGLVPQLDRQVTVVVVEAAADETEKRLRNNLKKQCPDLPEGIGLKGMLAALRRTRGGTGAGKVLLVIDQFEQWLHASREDESSELVQALRQCDGENLQCLLLVRDDFWMAATRFMRELEIPLEEGHNSAAVDLFPMRHARKVLAAFGRAYGDLPESPSEITSEQRRFLSQAVQGLAVEGKVICVRLALLAQMMKGRSWTPASLKKVGGAEGLRVTFLEETFSVSTAPPEHRYHQKAVRAVLSCLLPESGSDIKGNSRSEGELLRASGYARRRDFDDLVQILDSDLRLITPTDPAGLDSDSQRPARDPGPAAAATTDLDKAGDISGAASRQGGDTGHNAVAANGKSYQLTHDYLVPSLREWLTRKQKETRRGRAELRLGELAALWTRRPENRHLPSLWEDLAIRVLTDRRKWSGAQAEMMRRSLRRHASRVATVLMILVVLGIGVWGVSQLAMRYVARSRAYEVADHILDAEMGNVLTLVNDQLKPRYRPWADPYLQDRLRHAAAEDRPDRQLRASLALLPVHDEQVDYLRRRLLVATCEEFPVVRIALDRFRRQLLPSLWDVALNEDGEPAQRFRAAAALAHYAPSDDRWDRVASFTARRLTRVAPSELTPWWDALRRVQSRLAEPLVAVYRDPDQPAERRAMAADVLFDFYADRPDELFDLFADADPEQFAILFPSLVPHRQRVLELGVAELARRPKGEPDAGHLAVIRQKKVLAGRTDLARVPPDVDDIAATDRLARRQAVTAIAMLKLGGVEAVWPILQHREDPSARSYFIHWAASLGVDPKLFVRRLKDESDASSRRALILALGQYDERQFPPEDRRPLIDSLLELYRNDPDPGIHGAAEWLLRQWGQGERLAAANRDLRTNDVRQWSRADDSRTAWYVNPQGQTMVVLSAGTTMLNYHSVVMRHVQIDRTFAIADRAVTRGQFERYLATTTSAETEVRRTSYADDYPAVGISWYDAVGYCNWLSEQERIPDDQWCYLPNEQGEYAAGMRPAPGFADRTGYRLPTLAERVFATRAGSITTYYYGESKGLLGHYAWCQDNAGGRARRAGILKPNDFGLFNTMGNIWQWTQTLRDGYAFTDEITRVNDNVDERLVVDDDRRWAAGASFIQSDTASSTGSWSMPINSHFLMTGFRLARTVDERP